MAEPIQAAEVAASGSMGVALAVLGVNPGLLMLAVLGCGVGVLLTPDKPRVQSVLAFALSSPAGALLGGALSHDATWSRLVAFVAAAMAVPLLMGLRAALQDKAPDVWGATLDRILQVLRIKP